MKKCLVLLLLLFPVSLFAQNFRDAKIYVPPVTGTGRLQDNTFFYRQLTEEVILQFYSLVRARGDSDYVLVGVIEPFFESEKEKREVDYDNPFQKFVFRLELQDSVTGEMIARQEIFYNYVDEYAAEYLSVAVYNMLSWIPDIEIADYWRDNWLYLSASVLWTPRVYNGVYQSVYYTDFGLGFLAEFQFLNFMSLQMGVGFSQDWVITSSRRDEYYRDVIVEIPLAIKFVLKFFDNWMIEPYSGVHLNLSLINTTRPFFLSWMAGLQLGIKAGPGMVTIDPRFSMDLGVSYIERTLQPYQRFIIQIGIGYKFGFLPKISRRRN